jgi:ATP-dependent DNA helicase RecQ
MIDPVTAKCQSVFGIPYPYPWQRLIIAGVLDAVTAPMREPLRQIAVLPTGAGKSLCWMLPAVLVEGLTIAVFPLLSLMSDQERRLTECGIKSVVLRGGQAKSERKKSWNMLKLGEAKIVLANPEVLQSPEVESRLEKLHPTFLVVDETHTVSQWGESFRPACAEMGRLVKSWEPPAVLALTATAGPHMRERIKELLFNGETPTEALADPDRPAIRYGVYPSLSRSHGLDRLVRDLPRPAIVFGSTRPNVEQAARMLRRRLKNEEIRYYHAGLSREEKNRLEGWFLSSEDGILCATCAYGMGVDKKNIRTVIHLSPPSSAEAYLQESGRASRDGKGASAWLIMTPEDRAGLDNPRGRAGMPRRKPKSSPVAVRPS